MSPTERYQQLKKLQDKSQRERDRAQGALDQLMKTLEEEHGCSSEQEAEKLLEKTEREISKLEPRLEREMQELEKKFGHLLRE